MTSQHSILRVLRARSSVSLPDPSRLSLSFANNAPYNTPIIPSVYITTPEEEGNVSWCAIDGDAALSLDVPLPDIAALERTIEGLRKATTTAISRTPKLRRPSKKDTPLPPTPIHNDSEDSLLIGGTPYTEPQSSRQLTIAFVNTNEGNYREVPPQRPVSPSRHPSPPPAARKKGSLRFRASRVLQIFKLNNSSSSSQPTSNPPSPFGNRPSTPAYFGAPNGRLRQRRSIAQLFRRSDSPLPRDIETPPTTPLPSPLGIYPSPDQPMQVYPSPILPQSPHRQTILDYAPSDPLSSPVFSKPLPPLPEEDSTEEMKTPTLRKNCRSNPALSPPKQPKRRFSLTDLRHKWMQSSKPDSSTSTDHSTESSGSSAVASSLDQHEPAPTPRALGMGRRIKIESMHFPDLDLHFDETSF